MAIRTDLAMEHAIFQDESSLPRGIRLRRETKQGVSATVLKIISRSAAKQLGRDRGVYITLELGQMLRGDRDSFNRTVQVLGGYLRDLLTLPPSLPVLVAGLGNRDVTPDALGPMTAENILVTRHMLRAMPGEFARFRPVAALSPGVPGTTGVDSGDMIRAMAARLEAAAVIAVDALAARDTGRLCGTVQLTDTGIVPGSGLGSRMEAINRASLGIPVFSLGVPTVTDAATLAEDLLTASGIQSPELPDTGTGRMVVTCADIDRRIRDVSRLLSFTINYALQPMLRVEDLWDLAF